MTERVELEALPESAAQQPCSPPKLSVVLPVLNAREHLEALLPRLLEQECRREAWEVIVVDNGSSDGTWEYLQSVAGERVRVVREARRGPSAARNSGVRHARGEIVVFIDSDCLPRRDWLARMHRAFDNPDNWAVGGLLLSAPPQSLTEVFTARQGILNQEDFFKPMPYKPPFLLTANFAVRRSVFERIGSFDESLRVGEDADFCWRLLRAGGKMALVRDAVVEHRHRASLRSFARQMFWYGVGSAVVFARHRDFIGKRYWVDGRSYFCLGKSLVKASLYPFIRRDPYMRREGALEVVRFVCFLSGRLLGSLRARVLVL